MLCRATELAQEEERQSTPPLDEQEFEDDDGTHYVWDPVLRKFQPKGDSDPPAAAPNYGLDEMTFAVEEETIPAFTLPEVCGRPDLTLFHFWGIESFAESQLAAGLIRLCKQEEEEEGEEKAEAEDKEAAQPQSSQPSAPNGATSTSAGRDEAGHSTRHSARHGKKRGPEDVFERIADKQKKAKMQAEAQKQWFDLKVNTSVYVTGLPDDISEAQLAEVRSADKL